MIKIRWIVIFSLILLVNSVACSSTPTRRSFGQVIDDAVITNKLKVKFLKDKQVKGFKINIDTWKGIVSLRGRVDSQGQINRAIEMSEQQTGVREVKSYLVIKDSSYKSTKVTKKNKNPEVIEERDLAEAKIKKSSNKSIKKVEPAPEEEIPLVDEGEEEVIPQVTP